MELAPNTINELVVLLKQFMEDERNRRPFIVLALGNDAPVLQRITWSGSVATFIPDMVCKLADYGEITPGRQALWALLEYVRSQAGVDVQQRSDKLRPLIDLRSHSLVPTDISSGIKILDIDVLVQKVRSRLHDKIQRLHGTVQLLDVARPVKFDRLYVDVNILSEPTSYTCVEITDLLQGRDYQRDFNRFGLSPVQERVAGLKAVVDYLKLMILGKPGSGKTTFFQHVVIECNNGTLLADRVPIFIKLRDFVRKARNIGDFSLKRHIGFHLQDCTKPEVEKLLKAGKVLLLLDGLDEVPEADGNAIVNEIEDLSNNYDQNQLIITCRIQAQKKRFQRFTYVEVADFNSQQIMTFADKWFVANARNGEQEWQNKAKQFLKELELPENERIRELVVSPILLALTCKVFRDTGKFYSKHAKLYEQGLEILLSEWDDSRGIQRDNIYQKLTVVKKRALLSYVAIRKFEQEQYVLFEKREIQEYIASYLGISLEESQAVLESIEVQHGLLTERAQGIYSFSHLTFQEYFTTRWFIDRGNLLDLAISLTPKKWREVFLLATGITESSDNLLSLMKKWADKILKLDGKLQQFLTWVYQKSLLVNVPYNPATDWPLLIHKLGEFLDGLNQKSPSVQVSYKLAAIRALCYALVLERDLLDFTFAFTLDLTFALALIASGNPEITLDRILRIQSGTEIGGALQRALNITDPHLPVRLDQAIFHAFCDELSHKVGEVQKIQRQKWWVTHCRTLTVRLRMIVKDGSIWQFSAEQKELLRRYYDANWLLIDCLSSGCVVSDVVRQEIEDTLFLPMAEIERYRTK